MKKVKRKLCFRGGGANTCGVCVSIGIVVLLAGCPEEIPLDVVAGKGCCCPADTGGLCKCVDDEYGRACISVLPIYIEDLSTLRPGRIVTAEFKGGDDLDQVFPTEGQEWHEHCPSDCADYCALHGYEDETGICYVLVHNRNRVYVSDVYGYSDADENYLMQADSPWEEKFHSKYHYFSVDPRFPIPEIEEDEVRIIAKRDGAFQPEVIGENYALFEDSY